MKEGMTCGTCTFCVKDDGSPYCVTKDLYTEVGLDDGCDEFDIRGRPSGLPADVTRMLPAMMEAMAKGLAPVIQAAVSEGVRSAVSQLVLPNPQERKSPGSTRGEIARAVRECAYRTMRDAEEVYMELYAAYYELTGTDIVRAAGEAGASPLSYAEDKGLLVALKDLAGEVLKI